MAETANARILLWPLRCQCSTMREETGLVEEQSKNRQTVTKAGQKTAMIARVQKKESTKSKRVTDGVKNDRTGFLGLTGSLVVVEKLREGEAARAWSSVASNLGSGFGEQVAAVDPCTSNSTNKYSKRHRVWSYFRDSLSNARHLCFALGSWRHIRARLRDDAEDSQRSYEVS